MAGHVMHDVMGVIRLAIRVRGRDQIAEGEIKLQVLRHT